MSRPITRVAVPLSKRKLVLIFVGSCGFVAGSAWMMTWPVVEAILYFPVSLASVLFFGLCGVFALVKLADRRPGLVIDVDGIVDNSSFVAAGRIPWHEIEGIRTCEIAGQCMLIIEVTKPEKYAENGGWLKRFFKTQNRELVGSPISIASTALAMDFDELVWLLTYAFDASRDSDEEGAPGNAAEHHIRRRRR